MRGHDRVQHSNTCLVLLVTGRRELTSSLESQTKSNQTRPKKPILQNGSNLAKYAHFILSWLWSIDLIPSTLCHYTGPACVRGSRRKLQRQTRAYHTVLTHRTPIRTEHRQGPWCGCAEASTRHWGSKRQEKGLTAVLMEKSCSPEVVNRGGLWAVVLTTKAQKYDQNIRRNNFFETSNNASPLPIGWYCILLFP